MTLGRTQPWLPKCARRLTSASFRPTQSTTRLRFASSEQFEEAVIDAGIIRLRPVMITVGATVLALFPLAMHGGPLWQPLCYAQIGGLTVATFITLLMVPVFYSILVLDLKILTWDAKEDKTEGGAALAPESATAPATSGD